MVAQVRRFNRIVTQRVGALDDRFLARDRPLGRGPAAVGDRRRRARRALPARRLDLDSGYLSRLLRSLEAAGLVTVEPSGVRPAGADRPADRTRDGRAGRARPAQRRAGRVPLAPLSARQRARLVDAMAEVERLLTAAMVEVAPIDPAHPHARYCLRAYFSELDRRFETGFDPGQSLAADEEELRPPAGLLLVATCARTRSEPRRSGSATTSPPRSSGCGSPSPHGASASAADC